MEKTEKKGKKEVAVQFNYKLENGENKTSIILRLVGEGKNRDEITDYLCSLNKKVSRKSNAGSISTVLKNYGLRSAVGSGTRARKSPEEKIAEGKLILKKREKAINGS